jgi:plastocyanin
MRRPAATAALLALAVAAPVVATGAAAASATRTVTLKNVAFKPARVVVNRGGSVRWVWRDDVTAHNVTSEGRPRFRSSTTKNSGTYSVRFTRAGTYRYVCTIHFGMKGTVVVR